MHKAFILSGQDKQELRNGACFLDGVDLALSSMLGCGGSRCRPPPSPGSRASAYCIAEELESMAGGSVDRSGIMSELASLSYGVALQHFELQ